MNILISVDIEGMAGVFHPEQVRSGNPEYEQARRLMTQEANAAIAGAFDGGAQKVYVNDSHGRFRNMIFADLDARAQVIQGRPRVLSMAQGVELEGIGGLGFVGYHSRAGGKGILAHTINSSAFALVLFNGEPIGEAGIYGAVAGEYGVPVIFGSGDDMFIAENKSLFPHAKFAQTKQALGVNCGVSLSSEKACDLIRATMAKAVSVMLDSDRVPTFQLDVLPVAVTVHTMTAAQADLFCGWPGIKRIDTRTIMYHAQTAQDAMQMLNCCSAMAASLMG